MSDNTEYKRPSWDEYFMNLSKAVGERGTCDRGRSGCVIVKDKRVLSTGYVGSPAGMPHCDDAGHSMKKLTHEDGSVSQHCMRTAHAEANAISQAARFGIGVEGGTIYCKMVPCDVCCKMLVNAGIKRVVAQRKYHQGGDDLLKNAGVKVSILEDTVEEYENQ
jgi:dCMP deaminase